MVLRQGSSRYRSAVAGMSTLTKQKPARSGESTSQTEPVSPANKLFYGEKPMPTGKPTSRKQPASSSKPLSSKKDLAQPTSNSTTLRRSGRSILKRREHNPSPLHFSSDRLGLIEHHDG